MERLLTRTETDPHIIYTAGHTRFRFDKRDSSMLQRVFDRAYAYEDTGLEPGDIKAAFNEEAVLKLVAQALGATPDRLRELVEARNVIVETAANREYIDYICPKCGNIISQRRKGQKQGIYQPKYHDNCGQGLDWSRAEAEAAIGGGGDGT